MQKYIIAGLFALTVFSANAGIKGKVRDTNGDPVPGVNVQWIKTREGTVTDLKGNFEINKSSLDDFLVLSNVAYEADTVSAEEIQSDMVFTLIDNIVLNELEVVRRNKGSVHSRTAVLEVENINGHEFAKAACCNLSESFSTNPSVDVSYSDAATGAKQIRLLGLSGNYVQMLSENIPNFRGLSSVYGLGYIPGPWMEGISISKGTGSVVNGYESVAGQINVEYKKPDTADKLTFNAYVSDAGRMELNADAAVKLSENLYSGVLLHYSDDTRSLDDNKDGYMDLPMVKQYNFINRWLYSKDDYRSEVFFKVLSENRFGGTVIPEYGISINTERYEFFLKNAYEYNEYRHASIGMTLSGSLHEQQSNFGFKHYDGSQGNVYLNIMHELKFNEDNHFKSGLGFNFDNFSEQLLNKSVLNDDSKEFVPGIYTEYTYSPLEELKMVAGLRADYSTIYGLFITPRIHFRYAPGEHMHLRITAGKAYRTPRILAENSFYLASNREFQISEKLNLEEAWNFGASLHTEIHLGGKEIGLMGEWFYSDFVNQVVTDLDSDPHAVNFYNLNGKSYSSSLQFEANTELFRGMTMKLAHRINDVKTTIGGQLREKPLTSRFKTMLNFSYQTLHKGWEIDFTGQMNGGGRLPNSDNDNPLWNDEFKAFPIVNGQLTKFFKDWSVYAGVENLTNFVQKDPIVDVQDPFGDDFDATMIWGPVHGRKIYIGLRWAIKS